MSRDRLDTQQAATAARQMRRCILFADLDQSHIDNLLAKTRIAVLKDDEQLFEQGQAASELYLLTSGQIKLARTSPEGHEKVIDLISPGQSFAEALLFSGQHVYPVTATALSYSLVLCIDSRCYADILRESTDACFMVMAQMSRRLHWQIAEIDRLTLHNATFRVIVFLLDQVPSTDLTSSHINLGTPKHVIASRLSITPETLSRTFNKLVRDGLISINETTVTLHDLGKLRNYTRTHQF